MAFDDFLPFHGRKVPRGWQVITMTVSSAGICIDRH